MMPSLQTDQLYTIQQLSTRLKIPKPTLRFWEKELEGALMPLRTKGGQRRYTVEHIFVLEEIQKLKKEGMSLTDIKRALGNGESRHHQNLDLNGMDILVERIAKVVGKEIARFFKKNNVASKTLKADES